MRYQEIYENIKGLIESNSYRAGDKLPSVRQLCEHFSVSIGTVQTAYALLEGHGFIYSKPKSGFFASVKPTQLLEPQISTPTFAQEDIGPGHLIRSIYDSVEFSNRNLPFGLATLDPQLFPFNDLHSALISVSRRFKKDSLAYDYVPGSLKLRQQLAKLCLTSGCSLSADDFVLTNGAIEAFHVCLKAIAKPGDTIIVESPTYYGFLKAIQNMGMKALEISTHPREGIEIGKLSETLKKEKVSAILIVSNYNNPLGSTLPDEKKRDLVEIATKHGVPIIENDIFGDLSFSMQREKTCKSFDKKGIVLLCSSFSKTLAPGYRVGWTVPGKFKSRVEWLIQESTFASATLTRLAIAEYLTNFNYQKHLKVLRKHCSDQIQSTSDAIARHFPPETRLSRPAGGFILWVELPKKIDSFLLHKRAIQKKISVTPGSIFSNQSHFNHCIRISCGHKWTPELENGIMTLGKLATAFQTQTRKA